MARPVQANTLNERRTAQLYARCDAREQNKKQNKPNKEVVKKMTKPDAALHSAHSQVALRATFAIACAEMAKACDACDSGHFWS